MTKSISTNTREERVRIQLKPIESSTCKTILLTDAAMCFWRVLLGVNINIWVGSRKEAHSETGEQWVGGRMSFVKWQVVNGPSWVKYRSRTNIAAFSRLNTQSRIVNHEEILQSSSYYPC